MTGREFALKGMYSSLPKEWNSGAKQTSPDSIGLGIRENHAKGKKWDKEPSEAMRPKFDLMGKLQEWGSSKASVLNPKSYFYLEYLIDMEGYPLEVRNTHVSPVEHLNLRLLSLAEERKFWKAFYYYVSQYEFEDQSNVAPMSVNRTLVIEHALRMAGIAAPKILADFKNHGLDDGMLAAISLNPEVQYTGCAFDPDMINVLTGGSAGKILTDRGARPEQVKAFLGQVSALKLIRISFVNDLLEQSEPILCNFDEIPTFESILEKLDLPGGRDEYFFDVRDFYTTPGKMVFTDQAYQEFLLDYFLSGQAKFHVPYGTCLQVSRRKTPEEEKETSRGWFHVI
eukprot:TRINITY_DN3108_c0_g1_i2.p1 TRINITY_DN3108_c0_g1~~TRINITY_DN3108_c0_g1_i2.p1  ORF type:complete len:341 (+),score=40.98 TRINITY_DN3108_c0_g1_i2:99-1121(+)